MAVKIRLRQQGRKNHRCYRIVAADVRSPRDGKYLETLGWYNPLTQGDGGYGCAVNEERVLYWLNQGALITEKVEALIVQVAPRVLAEYRTKKMTAAKQGSCK